MRHLFAILTLLLGTSLMAQSVPTAVNYQGRLVDSNGDPLVGMKQIEFNIYDASSGGAKLWGPQTFQDVPLVAGEFNVIFTEDAEGRPVTDAFQSSSAHLGIRVGDMGGELGPEFSPRQQFLAVPYAFRSLDSESANVDALLARIEALENTVFPGGTVLMLKVLTPLTGSVSSGGVALNSNGESIVAFTTNNDSSFDFGGGVQSFDNAAIHFLRLSGTGDVIWSQSYESESFSTNVYSIALDDDDNIYVNFSANDTITVGDSTFEVPDGQNLGRFTVMLNPTATEVIWHQSFDFATGREIQLAPNGDVYLSGTYTADTLIGTSFLPHTNQNEVFVARLNGNTGEPLWARYHAAERPISVNNMAVGADSSVVISGNYERTMMVSSTQPPATSVFHHGPVSNNQMRRPYLTKYNADGSLAWVKGWGVQAASSTNQEGAGGVGIDSGNNVWMTMFIDRERDFGGGGAGGDARRTMVFVKFSPAGDWMEQHTFSDIANSENLGIAMAGDNMVVGGYVSLFSGETLNLGGADLSTGLMFGNLFGIGSSLQHNWSRGSATTSGSVHQMNVMGPNVVITGQIGTQTYDFGTGPVTPTRGSVFVVVYRH